MVAATSCSMQIKKPSQSAMDEEEEEKKGEEEEEEEEERGKEEEGEISTPAFNSWIRHCYQCISAIHDVYRLHVTLDIRPPPTSLTISSAGGRAETIKQAKSRFPSQFLHGLTQHSDKHAIN